MRSGSVIDEHPAMSSTAAIGAIMRDFPAMIVILYVEKHY
jgi:hypothetical protein